MAKERQAFTDKVKTIRTDSDKRIEKELNKEQITKWQEHKSRMMKKERRDKSSRRDKKSMRGEKMQRSEEDCYNPKDYGRGWK